jgi:hypothetical protein
MSKSKIHWYKYAAPVNFYPLAGKMIPFFTGLTILLFAIGLYMSFFVAPVDFQQGHSYRIIFIHVPAAWMGMFLYVLMAIYAGIGWAFNARLASMMATAYRANRSHLYLHLIGDRIVVGETRMGRVLGLGRAHDVDVDSDVSVYRIHLVAIVDR